VSHLLKGDRLEWSVPEGNWTILRFGYAPNGRINTHPEKAGAGLEVDKMNPAALDAHFDFLIQAVLKEVGPLTGESFTTLLIDSYEVGPQNWTPRFGEDFKRLRGYDLTPYLPAMTGRVIGSMFRSVFCGTCDGRSRIFMRRTTMGTFASCARSEA
jgi:hypothetical protein